MSLYKSLTLDGNAGGINDVTATNGHVQLCRLGFVQEVVANSTETLEQGYIKFRFLDSGTHQEIDNETHDSQLDYAAPLNPYIVCMPVVGEYVQLIAGPNDTSARTDMDQKETISWYYTSPIHMKLDLQNNATDYQWNLPYQSFEVGENDKASSYNESINDPDDGTEDGPLKKYIGASIQPDASIIPPHMYEGDVQFNGRFGQGIKFTATVGVGESNNFRGIANLEEDPVNIPLTIIRNGLAKDPITKQTFNYNGRYLDGLAIDPSSIYLTNGQPIPALKPISDGYKSARAMNLVELYHHADLGFETNQIILRSDRVMSLARKDTYIWSGTGISLATKGSISMDAPVSIILDSPQINLGSGADPDGADSQPAIRGDILIDVLQRIISAFSTQTGTCSAGPVTFTPPMDLNDLFNELSLDTTLEIDNKDRIGLTSKKVFIE